MCLRDGIWNCFAPHTCQNCGELANKRAALTQARVLRQASVDCFERINAFRAGKGLFPFLWDEKLYEFALAHSKEMFRADRTISFSAELTVTCASNVGRSADLTELFDVGRFLCRKWKKCDVKHKVLGETWKCSVVAIHGNCKKYYATQLFTRHRRPTLKVDRFGAKKGGTSAQVVEEVAGAIHQSPGERSGPHQRAEDMKRNRKTSSPTGAKEHEVIYDYSSPNAEAGPTQSHVKYENQKCEEFFQRVSQMLEELQVPKDTLAIQSQHEGIRDCITPCAPKGAGPNPSSRMDKTGVHNSMVSCSIHKKSTSLRDLSRKPGSNCLRNCAIEEFEEINKKRRIAGIVEVKWSEILYQKAMEHCRRIFECSRDVRGASSRNLNRDAECGGVRFSTNSFNYQFEQEGLELEPGHQKGAVGIFGGGELFFKVKLFST